MTTPFAPQNSVGLVPVNQAVSAPAQHKPPVDLTPSLAPEARKFPDVNDVKQDLDPPLLPSAQRALDPTQARLVIKEAIGSSVFDTITSFFRTLVMDATDREKTLFLVSRYGLTYDEAVKAVAVLSKGEIENPTALVKGRIALGLPTSPHAEVNVTTAKDRFLEGVASIRLPEASPTEMKSRRVSVSSTDSNDITARVNDSFQLIGDASAEDDNPPPHKALNDAARATPAVLDSAAGAPTPSIPGLRSADSNDEALTPIDVGVGQGADPSNAMPVPLALDNDVNHVALRALVGDSVQQAKHYRKLLLDGNDDPMIALNLAKCLLVIANEEDLFSDMGKPNKAEEYRNMALNLLSARYFIAKLEIDDHVEDIRLKLFSGLAQPLFDDYLKTSAQPENNQKLFDFGTVALGMDLKACFENPIELKEKALQFIRGIDISNYPQAIQSKIASLMLQGLNNPNLIANIAKSIFAFPYWRDKTKAYTLAAQLLGIQYLLKYVDEHDQHTTNTGNFDRMPAAEPRKNYTAFLKTTHKIYDDNLAPHIDDE